MALFADGPARVGGRVAVIRENSEAVIETLVKVVQFRQLILCQSLGREKIQRASVRIFKNGIQDWQVVAKSFSGGGWSNHDHVFTGMDSFCGDGLMRVQLTNAFGCVRSDKIGVNPSGILSPLRLARGEIAYRCKHFSADVASRQ